MLGHECTRELTTVRRLIGVALQEAGLDPKQTGRELLSLQGKLYGLGKVLGDQVAEVIELVGLTDAIDRRIQTYSGGKEAAPGPGPALPYRPRVLFLDEPTTGPGLAVAGADLGPHPRVPRAVRSHHLPDHPVPGWRPTSWLTVAITDQGRIVRQGTPAALKR